MQRLRVGLVGCGGIARFHVGNLMQLEDVEIVGLADPSEANLTAMRSEFPTLTGVPSFGTAEELYETVELDGVQLATPHTLHFAQVTTAVERGLHVLCEKPLACTPEHARAIRAQAEAAGVVVTVSYQRRFDPAYLYMQHAIAAGELGELQTVAVTCAQRWRTGTSGAWRQDPALSGGGMLMDSGSHMVDIMLWLVGQPATTVSALVDNMDTQVDINSVAMLSFAKGIHGTLTVNGNLPTTWIEQVLIIGTDGVLRYETEPQHPWRTGRLQHFRNNEIVQPLRLPRGMSTDKAWVDAIRGRSPNASTPEGGVRVAELTAAIYRSAEEGRVITLGESASA